MRGGRTHADCGRDSLLGPGRELSLSLSRIEPRPLRGFGERTRGACRVRDMECVMERRIISFWVVTRGDGVALPMPSARFSCGLGSCVSNRRR